MEPEPETKRFQRRNRNRSISLRFHNTDIHNWLQSRGSGFNRVSGFGFRLQSGLCKANNDPQQRNKNFHVLMSGYSFWRTRSCRFEVLYWKSKKTISGIFQLQINGQCEVETHTVVWRPINLCCYVGLCILMWSLCLDFRKFNKKGPPSFNQITGHQKTLVSGS